MKHKKILAGLMGMFIFGFISMSPTPVAAEALPGNDTTPPPSKTGVDCPDDGDCAKKTAFSFGTCKNDNVGISCLAVTILNFMSVSVGILVVGGITAGGIMYSASGGNPGRKAQGTKIIGNSVIGLVLYLLLWAIIQFLIPGGVFS